jgi:hypothetical protein
MQDKRDRLSLHHGHELVDFSVPLKVIAPSIQLPRKKLLSSLQEPRGTYCRVELQLKKQNSTSTT